MHTLYYVWFHGSLQKYDFTGHRGTEGEVDRDLGKERYLGREGFTEGERDLGREGFRGVRRI